MLLTVIVNDAMIPYVTDVRCMSDVHCLVLFHLSIPLSENSTCITYECQNHEIDQSGKECPNRHLMWSPEIATAFSENLIPVLKFWKPIWKFFLAIQLRLE